MAYPDSFPNIQYGTGGDISAIAEVRRHLNEPVAIDFTDTQIQYWLDRGTAEAARITKLIEGGVAYITLSTGVNVYSFPSALYSAPQDVSIEVETLFYCGQATSTPQKAQGGYALTQIDMRKIAHLPNTTAGPPSYWAIRNTDNNARNFYVAPAPAAGQNGHVIEILYYKAAQVYKAADASTTHYLPEYLREAPIWYAVAEAYNKKRVFKVANMYNYIFESSCAFFRMDDHPKPVDSSDTMTLPDLTQYPQ